MVYSIPAILLSQLTDFVARQMGLSFPPARWRDLERGIGSAARDFGFADAGSCVQWLLSSPFTRGQIEILASHLTVGETYFFRERKSFAVLEDHILPELIRSRRGTEQRLRIWSAGCCTGEEPYSVAILLSQMIPDLKDWNITILATDINPGFLSRASAGVYRDWSFRDTPLRIQKDYFKRQKEGRFEIIASIKKMVTFSYLNLVEDGFPTLLTNTNAIDLIFCRNVLMYFAPQRAEKVSHNLYRSLVDGGWLIVSPSETSHVLFSEFVAVNYPGVIVYKKDGRRVQAAEIRPDRLFEEPKLSYQPPWTGAESVVSILPDFRDLPPPTSEGTEKADVRPTPYGEAAVLYEKGRYAEAAEKLILWLSMQPDDRKAVALLARVYANQGKLNEALEACEDALGTDKLDAALHYLRAAIVQEQGLVDEARASLKRALYLDPHLVLAHFALGNLNLQQGRLNESTKNFENALSLSSAYRQDEILPESEGLTAGRLAEIIRSTTVQGASA
jgi:chemotaxis protein methyltransferase CheR